MGPGSKMQQLLLLPVSLFWLGCGGSFESRPAVPQLSGAEQLPPKLEEPLLLRQEERESEIPPYRVPEAIKERLSQENPDFVPQQSKSFDFLRPTLVINVKTSTMTFSGILKIKGREDEKVELRCSFDKDKTWACGNMFPTDAKIARERRIQASVNCEDSYNCDLVAIELYVLINNAIESQLFQTRPFAMRVATSGDAVEDEKVERPNDNIKVWEKPTPKKKAPERTTDTLSEKELDEILDDSNLALEIDAPISVPRPLGTFEHSIPEIEKYRPAPSGNAKSQAIGAHNRGRLKEPAKLPPEGPGYFVRIGRDRSFGTDSMVSLIQNAAYKMAVGAPNTSPIAIADISQKDGGRLSNRSGRFHASHQTGLDADIAFPLKNGATGDLWPVCKRGAKGKCSSNQPISENLDESRLWTLTTSMVCSEQNPVIAIFIDEAIKKHMCKWAQERFAGALRDPQSCAFQTLRAMKHSSGHHDHIHVRLRCPGNPDCRNATVSLGKSTGC